MKTRRALYNIIFGLLYYMVTVILGLLNRRVLVLTLGIEYQGINGLFSNILSMLSIAELGIGTAIVYHLYRPLAEHDEELVQCLMHFYKNCYHIIAGMILFLGLTVIPLLPVIAPDYQLPISIVFVYLCFLSDAVVSYLFTYKRSILIADQKNYVVLLADLLYQIILKTLQILLVLKTRDFICYILIMPLCRLGENLFLNNLVLKKYPYLKGKWEKKKLPKAIFLDIQKKVKGAIFHKIGTFFVLGTDNILISHFFGLAITGIYSNYELILNILKNISSQFVIAATAGVGRLLVENDKAKINSVFEQLQLINAGIMNFVATGVFCIISLIVTFVFGEAYIFSEIIVFALTIKFYVSGMRQVYAIFKETAGILYEDRFVPILESIINIVFSLILLHCVGVIGVFLGTIISSMVLFFYSYPVLVYKKVLDKRIRTYYLQLFQLSGIFLISLFLTKEIISRVIVHSVFVQIVVNCLVCCIVPNLLFYFLYARRQNEWKLLLKRIPILFSLKQ